jgi:hypothetical protein
MLFSFGLLWTGTMAIDDDAISRMTDHVLDGPVESYERIHVDGCTICGV